MKAGLRSSSQAIFKTLEGSVPSTPGRHMIEQEFSNNESIYLMYIQDLVVNGIDQPISLKKFESAWGVKFPEIQKEEWVADCQAVESDWKAFRGIRGGSLIHTLFLLLQLKFCEAKQLQDIESLIKEMGTIAPEMLCIKMTDEPYCGQTPIHMAIENANIELLEFLLDAIKDSKMKKEVLSTCVQGMFAQMMTVHVIHAGLLKVDGLSPLDYAMFAPKEDDVAVAMTKLLLRHGCPPVIYDTDGYVHGNILHRLAKSWWPVYDSGEVGYSRMGEDRLRTLMGLFCGNDADQEYQLNLSKVDSRGRTPLQVAAMIGNHIAATHILKQMVVPLWSWGQTTHYGIPMSEIDCRSHAQCNENELPVLEMIVLYRHRNLANQIFFRKLVNAKWNKFGFKCVCIQGFVATKVLVLCMISLLPEGKSWHGKTWQKTCAIIAAFFSLFELVCLLCCYCYARKSQLIQRMPLLGGGPALGMMSVNLLRQIPVCVCVLLVLGLDVWERTSCNRHDVCGGTDLAQGTAIFILWINQVQFFTVFEGIGVLIACLPKVLALDMVPWTFLYLCILFGTAGAIRVATSHTAPPSDEVVGSYVRAALTLEEATHGPDVQWRYFVYTQPVIAAAFFLIFLWLVTIILFNLLIAQLTDRYEEVKQHALQVVIEHRAKEVVFHEKMMPLFMHKALGCDMHSETPINIGSFLDNFRQMRIHQEPDVEIGKLSHSETTPLLHDEQGKQKNWFLIPDMDGSLFDDQVESL